jgi:hypothetical protein
MLVITDRESRAKYSLLTRDDHRFPSGAPQDGVLVIGSGFAVFRSEAEATDAIQRTLAWHRAQSLAHAVFDEAEFVLRTATEDEVSYAR